MGKHHLRLHRVLPLRSSHAINSPTAPNNDPRAAKRIKRAPDPTRIRPECVPR